MAVFKEAKRAGLSTAFVSNQNGTPKTLDYVHPWIDLYKVDLKSFNNRRYRELGGRLEPILDTIRRLWALGFWVEIVTLLIQGFNDTNDELNRLTAFIASVSPEIPWHITAFHSDYKMANCPDTTPNTLLRAVTIGRKNALQFVYAGNRPGQVNEHEHSHCPTCRTPVIERHGYRIPAYRLNANGACPICHMTIPGRWDL